MRFTLRTDTTAPSEVELQTDNPKKRRPIEAHSNKLTATTKEYPHMPYSHLVSRSGKNQGTDSSTTSIS